MDRRKIRGSKGDEEPIWGKGRSFTKDFKERRGLAKRFSKERVLQTEE